MYMMPPLKTTSPEDTFMHCRTDEMKCYVLATDSPPRALAWLLKAGHGGLPVSISRTVQATDQMSACRPAPVCLITSGAIQLGVPAIDLCPDSARGTWLSPSHQNDTRR